MKTFNQGLFPMGLKDFPTVNRSFMAFLHKGESWLGF